MLDPSTGLKTLRYIGTYLSGLLEHVKLKIRLRIG